MRSQRSKRQRALNRILMTATQDYGSELIHSQSEELRGSAFQRRIESLKGRERGQIQISPECTQDQENLRADLKGPLHPYIIEEHKYTEKGGIWSSAAEDIGLAKTAGNLYKFRKSGNNDSNSPNLGGNGIKANDEENLYDIPAEVIISQQSHKKGFGKQSEDNWNFISDNLKR